jgi:hypothetical protein
MSPEPGSGGDGNYDGGACSLVLVSNTQEYDLEENDLEYSRQH